MPCTPVSIPTPTIPSSSPIPIVGVPFALKIPGSTSNHSIPSNFPENLLDLFNNFQLLIPPGTIKPNLSVNYSKDIFDAILSLMDKFFPFLMLYKFFLPVLNLIICIIEVLCALMNPFALISAINRLFNQCIPAFLNLFPVFALIVMIISLLILILALIEYIISQVEKLVQDLLRNITALQKAFQDADANGVLIIAQKLGALLCAFQNLFVLLSIFNVVIEIIQDILRLSFAIPPCGDSSSGDTSGCCSSVTCPEIVKNPYTNTTGTFQYLPQAGLQTNQNPIPFFGNTTFDLRNESWQIYDIDQTISQAFINIVNAHDIPSSVNPKPIFFPTDASYTFSTPPNQAAYTMNLRLFYNPLPWDRTGTPRYIRFTNCIVTKAPTTNLDRYDNSTTTINNGVLLLAGGLGYEDDGTTVLNGYDTDGHTPINNQATLENFIHMPAEFVYNPTVSILQPTDGYTFSDATYTFTPNLEVLFAKQLITLGCLPSIALNRSFVNTVLYGDVASKTLALSNLVNQTGNGGNNVFPDPNAAVNCLSSAIISLQNNMTTDGVAQFQTTTTLCLNQLQNDTVAALGSLIGIGFNACNSTMTRDPQIQFTSRTITVTVDLNENNGINLMTGMPASVGIDMATKLKGYQSFGEITNFTFDGYQSFTAQISSDTPGQGQVSVAFDNQILCTNVISSDPTVAPVHTLQSLNYQFIFTPGAGMSSGVSDSSEGNQPRRDESDLGRNDRDR